MQQCLLLKLFQCSSKKNKKKYCWLSWYSSCIHTTRLHKEVNDWKVHGTEDASSTILSHYASLNHCKYTYTTVMQEMSHRHQVILTALLIISPQWTDWFLFHQSVYNTKREGMWTIWKWSNEASIPCQEDCHWKVCVANVPKAVWTCEMFCTTSHMSSPELLSKWNPWQMKRSCSPNETLGRWKEDKDLPLLLSFKGPHSMCLLFWRL